LLHRTSVTSNSPEILSRGANLTIATWRHLYVIGWRGAVTLDAVKLADELLTRFCARVSGPVAVMIVIEPHTPPPDRHARNATIAVLRRLAPRILCLPVVCEGQGFLAGAQRAAIAGMNLILRYPYPHKTFAGVDEATEWLILRGRHGSPQFDGVTPEDLSAVVSAARGRSAELDGLNVSGA
jgi:hypothetical protein